MDWYLVLASICLISNRIVLSDVSKFRFFSFSSQFLSPENAFFSYHVSEHNFVLFSSHQSWRFLVSRLVGILMCRERPWNFTPPHTGQILHNVEQNFDNNTEITTANMVVELECSNDHL